MRRTGKVGISTVVIMTITIILFNLCLNSPPVEGRPSRPVPLLIQRLQTQTSFSFPRTIAVINPRPYYEYAEYEDLPLQQGPRRRRWAFPDVQENCPPGQRPHSSGYGCVPDGDGFDDY